MDACFQTLVGVSDALLAGIERSVEGAESGEEEIARLAGLYVDLQGQLEAYAAYAEELAKVNQLLRDCVENDALRRWVSVRLAERVGSRLSRSAWSCTAIRWSAVCTSPPRWDRRADLSCSGS